MGVTPALRVRDRSAALRRLAVPAGVALATVAVVGLLSRPGLPALTAFGTAAFVLTGLAGELPDRLRRTARGRLAGLVAHAGIALVAVGVAGSSAYGRDAERTVRTGESLRVGDVSVRLIGVDRRGDGGGMAVHARLRLSGSGDAERTVTPALRYHPARDTAVTMPVIEAGLLRDTYVTLIAVSPDDGSATLRLAVNPLVGLLWAGGALTAVGGLGSAIGAARPRRRAGTPGEEARPASVGVHAGAPG
jgi:cytochrome c-type biogenesis protein CcmF